MRLHRFFLSEDLKNQKEARTFSTDLIHQWKDVFRLKALDRIILLDNSGMECLSEITLLSKEKAEFKIVESSKSKNIPDKEVWLFAALIKKDNFEWILEKCTEIGVSHFVPIVSDRSEKKNLNMERAQKILKEASEQSGRGIMPVLHEITHLEDALKLAEENSVNMVALHPSCEGDARIEPVETEGDSFTKMDKGGGAYEGTDLRFASLNSLGTHQRSYVSSSNDNSIRVFGLHASNPTGILVGPEGGWGEREVEIFRSKNIPFHSLGAQVLRAETAAIVASALLIL